jgi:excisionase family DNA binding protein
LNHPNHVLPTEIATVAEVAERLKVDPSTVRRWISSGVLKAVRIGGTTLRVDLASLTFEPIGGAV